MNCREEIRKPRAAQIALQKSMADQQGMQTQSLPNQVQSNALPDPALPPPQTGQPPIPNYAQQFQTQLPINQFALSQAGFQQSNTGYRLSIATNAMQLSQQMFQPFMPPIGFPTPSVPQYYGYPIPSQQASIASTTPSSAGFAQGERRTSFDPSWSPSFIT